MNICKRKKHIASCYPTAIFKELFDTAPLHDIGKVGISDSILLKPGRLTFTAEYADMKKHVMYGVNALQYEVARGQSPSFINTAIECIAGHHEKYDGTGFRPD